MMGVLEAELCRKYAVLMQKHRNKGGALGSPRLIEALLQCPRRADSRDDHPRTVRQLLAGRGLEVQFGGKVRRIQTDGP